MKKHKILLHYPPFFSSFSITLFIIFVCLSFSTFAQNPDEQKQGTSQDATTELAADTTDEELPSDLIFRIDYYSKVLTAGRDFGTSQYGISPSITYYHKSGIYGGLTSNLYSQSEPRYAMTDVTLGYSNFFKFAENWSYTATFDHYFFNPTSNLLSNSLAVYTNYDFGKVNVGTSYSFFFGGNETGNRINPSIGGYFKIKNVGFIDKITFSPTLSATIATDNIAFSKFSQSQFETFYNSTSGNALAEKILKRKRPALYSQYLKEKETNPGLTVEAFSNEKGIKFQAPNQTQEKTVFGLMSWNFSLPVKFRIKNLSLGITYNYVIPVLLPDESYTTEVTNQSYFSANLSYTFSK